MTENQPDGEEAVRSFAGSLFSAQRANKVGPNVFLRVSLTNMDGNAVETDWGMDEVEVGGVYGYKCTRAERSVGDGALGYIGKEAVVFLADFKLVRLF